MNRTFKNCSLASSATGLQVFVTFEVTITEVYSRTDKDCDEQSARFRYEFGSDFERAKHWLESDHTWSDLGSLASEACGRWTDEPGETR